MARGGRRAGAGRKPKAAVLRLLDGNAGRRGRAPDEAAVLAAIAPRQAAAVLVEPPADLTDVEVTIWRRLAPLAVAAGTLVESTVPGFTLMVHLAADLHELRTRFVRRDKPLLLASESEMGFRREARALARELRAMFRDFAIEPLGKEMLAPAAPADDDPLAAWVNRKRGL
jgi:hypothetical protein